MSTWGQNPYRPYTNQADQWEQEQQRRRDEETQRYRDRLAMVSSTAGTPTVAGSAGTGRTRPDRHVSAGSSGGAGLFDAIGAWLGDGALWVVNHVWPLRIGLRTGQRLAGTGTNWKLNAPLALLGALVLPSLLTGAGALWPGLGAWVMGVSGAYGVPVLLALGAVAGWFLVPATGVVLVFAAGLIGLAILLAVLAGLAWGAMALFRAIAAS